MHTKETHTKETHTKETPTEETPIKETHTKETHSKASTARDVSAPSLDHVPGHIPAVLLPSPTLLAEAVTVDGFDAHADAVIAFVAETRRLRISDVLAAVALDRHQPLVARERALGRLIAAYCRVIEQQTAPGARPASTCFTVAA